MPPPPPPTVPQPKPSFLLQCGKNLATKQTRLKATAVLVDQADESGRHRVDGRISFVQANCTSAVAVKGVIFGLSDGLHGFHVHEFGLLDGDCTTSGHHYNPFKVTCDVFLVHMLVGLQV